MTTRKKTLLTLGLLATLAIPLAAARRPATGGGGGAFLERAARRLDLTAEQKDQIRAILADHKNELEAEVLAIKTTRSALWDAIHASNPGDATIRAAAVAVGKAEGELGVTRADVVQEVKQVLTAEQQAELEQMAADGRAFVQGLLERIRAHVDAALG